ncbi:hypothetical protein [Desulfurobacterium atlanticum]|uniref:Uncharacterized protein n=1 Tax=Desulfurobacterium atlanticum TaxID=240169 RepID=A0A238YKN8_9BACT|nr:hypothetical protein [Desulfurobacterium atlanticum]SNR71261.1 hypothetical protein SAMN06265340_103206 [Desulfurobacterium atlanticum]
MKLEEILFGLIGTGGCWKVFLKTGEGEGSIYIHNGNIIRVEYKNASSELKGEDALKTIIKNSPIVKSVDLQPCKQKVEKNIDCDFSLLMSLFEQFKMEEDALEAISEIETNIQNVYEQIIVDSEKFKEVLEVCSNIFSEGSMDVLLFFDKNGVLKIEGVMKDADIDFREGFSVFVNAAKEVCKDSEYIEIISNIGEKFIYGLYNLKLEAGLVAVFDIIEKANFELDQDLIREAFENVFKKL